MKHIPRKDTLPWITTFLQYTLLASAIAYIGMYLYLVFFRIQYPFTLEWQEGMSLEQVRRILAGQKLYVPPSIEFAPYNYTPLYFYTSALVSKLVGEGFVPLRLVSFLSSLGCFWMIFLFVRREIRDLYPGIIASGLFAATYRISGAWFDIARIDSLFLVLLLLAIYFIRSRTSFVSSIVTGVLMTLSFLTKQTALVIALPIIVYCIFISWRHALVLISTLMAGIVGSTLFLDYLHDGWYSYYIFGLLQNRQPIIKNMLISFWSRDILSPLGIAVCLAICYLFVRFTTSKKAGFFYLFVTIGMVGGAWVARVKAGGYDNNLMPAYAVIAILFGLAVHTIFECLQKFLANQQKIMQIYVYLICLMQFVALVYHPFKQIPTQQDLEAGRRFVAELTQISGDIFLSRHGYMLALIGKRSFAQEMAIHDILSGDQGNTKFRLAREIRQAIAEKRFGAIIIDSEWWFSDAIDKYYEKQRRVFDNERIFWPVTGYKTRPEFIYVPKHESL
jgi:hypothetical protein